MVILIAATVGGIAMGSDVAHHKYAEAGKWAITLLIALAASFRKE